MNQKIIAILFVFTAFIKPPANAAMRQKSLESPQTIATELKTYFGSEMKNILPNLKKIQNIFNKWERKTKYRDEVLNTLMDIYNKNFSYYKVPSLLRKIDKIKTKDIKKIANKIFDLIEVFNALNMISKRAPIDWKNASKKEAKKRNNILKKALKKANTTANWFRKKGPKELIFCATVLDSMKKIIDTILKKNLAQINTGAPYYPLS